MFFYVGCDPSVLLVLPLIHWLIFHLFSCARTSPEKYFEFGESLDMPPTNGHNIELLVCLVTKKSMKSAENVISRPHRGEKNSTKRWAS